MGLGYITGLCELSPRSETAPGLGIIMRPQQMVEADRETVSCGPRDLPASLQSRTWEGPRWTLGEMALNQDQRMMGWPWWGMAQCPGLARPPLDPSPGQGAAAGPGAWQLECQCLDGSVCHEAITGDTTSGTDQS